MNHPAPQISSTAQTMTHGNSADQSCAWVSGVVSIGLTGGTVAAESSRVRNAGDNQNAGGVHILRKPIRQPIEISEAPISTIQGLM